MGTRGALHTHTQTHTHTHTQVLVKSEVLWEHEVPYTHTHKHTHTHTHTQVLVKSEVLWERYMRLQACQQMRELQKEQSLARVEKVLVECVL